jgi:hypothetical protein
MRREVDPALRLQIRLIAGVWVSFLSLILLAAIFAA